MLKRNIFKAGRYDKIDKRKYIKTDDIKNKFNDIKKSNFFKTDRLVDIKNRIEYKIKKISTRKKNVIEHYRSVLIRKIIMGVLRVCLMILCILALYLLIIYIVHQFKKRILND
jgi:hypothetical protein